MSEIGNDQQRLDIEGATPEKPSPDPIKLGPELKKALDSKGISEEEYEAAYDQEGFVYGALISLGFEPDQIVAIDKKPPTPKNELKLFKPDVDSIEDDGIVPTGPAMDLVYRYDQLTEARDKNIEAVSEKSKRQRNKLWRQASQAFFKGSGLNAKYFRDHKGEDDEGAKIMASNEARLFRERYSTLQDDDTEK